MFSLKNGVMVLILAASCVAAEDAALAIQTREIQKQSTLVIRKTVKLTEIGAALGGIFPKVAAYLESKKVKMLGPPFTRYLKETAGVYEIEAGIPVPDGTAGNDDIVASTIPGGTVAVVTHTGPYDKLSKTYEGIDAWLSKNKHEKAGPQWEVYVSDPGEVKPEELKTDIFTPIK